MNKNLYHTKNRINETVARLQRVESCNKSIEKQSWVKATDKVKLDGIFGLMYFRDLLDVDLYQRDLFSVLSMPGHLSKKREVNKFKNKISKNLF